MENKLFEIKDLLLKKSSAKQKAFRSTKEAFTLFKSAAERISEKLHKEVTQIDANVEVKFYEKSEYEMHLKFSGDTLVLMMHTNIFDFEPNHFIHQSDYIKSDPMRQYTISWQIALNITVREIWVIW
jgi:2,3-bisphosphoglycerate-independent phosphoglycerate mutase